MSSDSQILLKVPQEVIDAQVRAAVAAALGRDPAKLVQAVVDAALNEKDSRGYSSKTIFQEQVAALVRQVAIQEFQAFLESKRPEIAARIRKALGESAESLVDKLAAKCADGVLKLNVEAWIPRDGS